MRKAYSKSDVRQIEKDSEKQQIDESEGKEQYNLKTIGNTNNLYVSL